MSYWSAEYGTFVLCAAFILACVAVAVIRWYDVYEVKRAQYVTRNPNTRSKHHD